jgi:hypothetical protein
MVVMRLASRCGVSGSVLTVRFVVYKVAMRHIFLQISWVFHCESAFHRCSIPAYHRPLRREIVLARHT